ncbi:MAG TPA: hypothetical protein VMC09_18730 [Anaerolineales bacterium]|nr:hypothetical protein [Anaerolineales bacterium]
MPDKLHKESFAPFVNTTFQACLPGTEPVILTLTDVTEHLRTSRQEAFSVFFRGPADRFMPQGTVLLKHAQMGELELFIVPIGKKEDGFEYEAVFNYLIPSSGQPENVPASEVKGGSRA